MIRAIVGKPLDMLWPNIRSSRIYIKRRRGFPPFAVAVGLSFYAFFSRSASPSKGRWRSRDLSVFFDGILVLVNTFVIASLGKVGLGSCFIIRV